MCMHVHVSTAIMSFTVAFRLNNFYGIASVNEKMDYEDVKGLHFVFLLDVRAQSLGKGRSVQT